MNYSEIDKMLSSRPEYRDLLFCKGFLITDDDTTIIDYFSLSWEHTQLGRFHIWHDKKLPLYICKNVFLLGHAINPYDMETEEQRILENLSIMPESEFHRYAADLSGVYVMGRLDESGELFHWSDCSGMLISYYGRINGKYYLTSHVNIVSSYLNLTEDPYISKLKTSRYFKLFGIVLPADLSPYLELRRTVPNYEYSASGTRKRFYPFEPIKECESEEEYQYVLAESADILRKTLSLYTKKWSDKKLAISLTGGKDSGVTFSSANGLYDKFSYFSYISKPQEAVDANAAEKICHAFSLPHRIISIPENNEDIPDFDCLKELIAFNGGNVGYLKSSEIRKRSVLIGDTSIDVEIKSWVDEISRAYLNKQYKKNSFPQHPTGRYIASIYKVFLENRLILKQTATMFDKYISEYMSEADIALMGDWSTLYTWEFRYSACNGQHMTVEHILSYDIAVPFNNRHLIYTMLKPQLSDRIHDRLQRDIIRLNNKPQADLGINITNAAHTDKRAKLEKAYLEINSRLPF